MQLQGSLSAVLSEDRLGVTFRGADGRACLDYRGLRVFDSTRRELAAELAVVSSRLQIRIADEALPILFLSIRCSMRSGWAEEGDQKQAQFGFLGLDRRRRQRRWLQRCDRGSARVRPGGTRKVARSSSYLGSASGVQDLPFWSFSEDKVTGDIGDVVTGSPSRRPVTSTATASPTSSSARLIMSTFEEMRVTPISDQAPPSGVVDSPPGPPPMNPRIGQLRSRPPATSTAMASPTWYRRAHYSGVSRGVRGTGQFVFHGSSTGSQTPLVDTERRSGRGASSQLPSPPRGDVNGDGSAIHCRRISSTATSEPTRQRLVYLGSAGA